ncbi:CCAAT/enhancer-binding protein delta-like [Paramacrobiotus metropolitanus]|uniref:CCAAT/enhancer-binding protein delta-like n=1 Tax=Paramacrobiotus metropolitanus TaxID=2943436 RepID=UPI0024461304|nr:CCAAT/enhancer-binding protein delta-like [Paramacrobiotus metropolitanus]
MYNQREAVHPPITIGKSGSSQGKLPGQQPSPSTSRKTPQRKGKSTWDNPLPEPSCSASSLTREADNSVASGKGLSSDESYSQRRKKNNEAVRKSRESKRQKELRFREDHDKLKKEIEAIKSRNDQLQTILAEIEDGVLDAGKSKQELSALVQNARQRLLQ